jgi:hypothetical protein
MGMVARNVRTPVMPHETLLDRFDALHLIEYGGPRLRPEAGPARRVRQREAGERPGGIEQHPLLHVLQEQK